MEWRRASSDKTVDLLQKRKKKMKIEEPKNDHQTLGIVSDTFRRLDGIYITRYRTWSVQGVFL